MMEYKDDLDKEVHKKLAIDLFHFAWELIEKAVRSEAENDMMVNAAHASRFHQGLVGTPLNLARGEWQISRVYSLVNRGEPALSHAQKSLDLTVENQLSDFELGFAHEAMARAYAVTGDTTQRDAHIALAKECAERVNNEEDRTWLMKNVNTVQSLSLPKWHDN